MHITSSWYVWGRSTIAIIAIVVAAVILIALVVVAGRRRRHAQLRDTVGEHRQEAQRHANRANELEAAAAEARERERTHAQTAAEAEQKLPS